MHLKPTLYPLFPKSSSPHEQQKIQLQVPTQVLAPQATISSPPQRHPLRDSRLAPSNSLHRVQNIGFRDSTRFGLLLEGVGYAARMGTEFESVREGVVFDVRSVLNKKIEKDIKLVLGKHY